MRTIISLYRGLTGALFLGVSAGLAYLLGRGLASLAGPPSDAFGTLGLLGSIAAFTALLLFVGIVAAIISIHDKLSELVDAILKGR